MSEFIRHSVIIQISRQMGLDNGLVEPTEAEAAEWQVARAKYATKVAQAWVVYDAARPALAAITDPVSRLVLDLHASDTAEGPRCQGCDMDGYEAEPPEWPCRTVQVVADHHGVALPDPGYLYRRPTTEEQA